MPGVGVVVSVNVGRSRPMAGIGKAVERSAIDKRPMAGPVQVGVTGLDGDEQADRVNHGGLREAVYAYAEEDLQHFSELLDRPLRPGQFGENVTTRGVAVSSAIVGEVWRVGTTVLEVCGPRIPCRTFQVWMEEPQWVRRFTAEARPGAYLRVMNPGVIEAGDQVQIEHRPDHGLTVADVFRAFTTDRSQLAVLARHPGIPQRLRDDARRRLARS
ncbi:MAG: MOSC domain-containing protein [Acidothermus sp.]|nr:MOSC domain-containing protein [Acidothermus sp.]